MSRLQYLTVFCLLFLVLSCTPEKDYTSATSIDEIFQQAYEDKNFNGTVIIQRGDSILYQNALGIRNRETEEPLTITSQFYLGSVAKQFTTMAILILKEKGLVEYDTRLREIFPDFPDYAEGVTVRHLMTHTSGIADHFALNAYKPGLSNADVYALLKEQTELNFEPGEKYSYSNGGYVLLSMIVEKLSEQPFHEFMKENVFDVLEMQSTLIYDESDPEIRERVTGYSSFGRLDDYEIYTLGAGGMYSNAPDVIKWLRGVRDYKLVSKETMDEAFTPFELNDGSLSDYGFGWSLDIKDGELKTVFHSGSLNGFRTYDQWGLKTDIRIVILTSWTNDLRPVAVAIVGQLEEVK